MEKNKLFNISEFRRELGIPLVFARKLISWGIVEAMVATDGTIQITESELLGAKEYLRNPWTKTKLFIKSLGPGIITGASDDDPSGIGTYSSVGATFGFGLIWLALWLLPLMTAVQETCARVGIVTNRGLAGVLRKHYGSWIVMIIVILLIIANTANIGADISAMTASVRLLAPSFNFTLTAIIIALLIIILEVKVAYKDYAKFLKWLTLSLLAYIITGFIIRPDWIGIFKTSLIPDVVWNKEYIFAIIAVFGTTISPYLFFWQTSEEVEENKYKVIDQVEDNKDKKVQLLNRIKTMRTDTKTGMLLANLVFLFIVITTAKVLNAQGITTIGSAEQAAMALRPLAGDQAFLLFALGIIGTGLLAIPVLAGSGAYALAELFHWKEGLGKKFSQAKSFYTVIILSILVGLGLNFLGVSPIKALYYSAFLNGVIAVPLLYVIMVIGGDKKIMGDEIHPGWVRFFGWMAFAFSAVAVIGVIVFSFIK